MRKRENKLEDGSWNDAADSSERGPENGHGIVPGSASEKDPELSPGDSPGIAPERRMGLAFPRGFGR
jgi:hypothetical protein